MGRKASSFKIKVKEQEEKNRKYLTGWGHTDHFVCGEKAQSWHDIWGLLDWIYCVSDQGEHLQGHETI